MNKNRFSLFHRFIFFLLRVFYDQFEIDGREKIPAHKVLFVANHPNGLLDPIILMIVLTKRIRFLAMSRLFAMPVIGWACRKFQALPIYRGADIGRKGGPKDKEDATRKNEETFAASRAHLRDGGYLALFPEGSTHSDPQMLPMRTGAARVALSTEVENDWEAGLTIVPVGFWYERKRMFRSSVFLKVGTPFTLQEYRQAYETDDRETVRDLTERIGTELDEIVLQAEEIEVLRAAPFIANWVATPEETDELHEVYDWTNRLLNAYMTLRAHEPARLEKTVDTLQAFAKDIRMMGITDPWSLEIEENRGRLVQSVIWLVLSAPFALLGFLFGYIPFRATGWVANTVMADDTTQTSLVKALGGFVFFFITWIIGTLLFWVIGSGYWAILFFLLAPALCALAMEWIEVWNSLRSLQRHQQIRRQKGEEAELLLAQREEVAAEVLEAVHFAESLSGAVTTS